jgi:hypothetical protein
MPTTIVFAAPHGDRSLAVRVEQDPNDVFAAWTAAGGLPFALTEAEADEAQVWISPGTVAYWHETRSGPAYFG